MQTIRTAFWRYKGSILVLVLTTVLTLGALRWMGYDLGQLSETFIGDGGDAYNNSWFLYQCMENLLNRPNDLGYSTSLYGEKSPLAFTIAPYGIAIITLPVYVLSGRNLELTYNLYWIATFPLAAWSIYLLVRYLFGVSSIVGTLAGLMTAFAQWRFLQLTHIEMLSMYLFVLMLYCFHRLLDTPRLIWSIGLAIFFILGTLAAGYFGFELIVIATVLLAYAMWRRKTFIAKGFLRGLLLAAVISSIVCAIFLSFRFRNAYFGQGFTVDSIISASPADWIRGTSQIYTGFMEFKEERMLFLGLTPLVLSLAAWLHRRRLDDLQLNQPRRRVFSPMHSVTIYAWIVIIAYVMTLGPVFVLGDTLIPLPYMIFVQVPAFGWMRIITEFIMVAIVGTSVLSAYTLLLISRSTDRLNYRLALATIAVVVAIELLPANGSNTNRVLSPTPPLGSARLNPVSRKNNIPPIYTWLAQQPPETPVFHYPNAQKDVFIYHYYQRFHNQPMLNGYGAFEPVWYVNTKWDQFPTPEIMQVITDRAIKYVIVHNDMMTADEQTAFKQRLTVPTVAGKLKLDQSIGTSDVYKVQ